MQASPKIMEAIVAPCQELAANGHRYDLGAWPNIGIDGNHIRRTLFNTISETKIPRSRKHSKIFL